MVMAGRTKSQRLSHWTKFTMASMVVLWSAAAVFYLLHLYLLQLFERHGLHSDWFDLLGFLAQEAAAACLVAFFLGLSVEYFNQRRHTEQSELVRKELDVQRTRIMEQINENILKTIYKRNIPAPIFEHVERFLLRSDFLRRNYSVDLTLERTALEDGQVRARLTIDQRFDMWNLTDSSATYQAQSIINADPRSAGRSAGARMRFISAEFVTYTNNGVQIGTATAFRGNDLLHRVKPSLDGASQVFTHHVEVPRGGYVSVVLSHEAIQALDGADMLCCLTPADGMSITILTPRKDFGVDVVSMHPEDAILMRPRNGFSRTWQSRHPIFPGQDVSYQWYPIDAQSLHSGIQHAEIMKYGKCERKLGGGRH
jgi:hypothetical protein